MLHNWLGTEYKVTECWCVNYVLIPSPLCQRTGFSPHWKVICMRHTWKPRAVVVTLPLSRWRSSFSEHVYGIRPDRCGVDEWVVLLQLSPLGLLPPPPSRLLPAIVQAGVGVLIRRASVQVWALGPHCTAVSSGFYWVPFSNQSSPGCPQFPVG